MSRHFRRFSLILVTLLACSNAACDSDTSGSAEEDTGPVDATTDSLADTGSTSEDTLADTTTDTGTIEDTAAETAADAGSDAFVTDADAATDAETDTASDTGADVASDAADAADAEASTDAGLVTKYVFVTQTTYDGNLGGVSGADAKCKSAADSGLAVLAGRTWKAWISDSTSSPSTRLSHAADRYVLPDGTLFAHGWSGLTGSSLSLPHGPQVALNQTEHGTAAPTATANPFTGPAAWTWTRLEGTPVEPTSSGHAPCGNWTNAPAVSTLPDVQGAWGQPDDTGALVWTYATNAGCNLKASVYCFEQ